MATIVSVEHLSKQYVIGEHRHHNSLRDALTERFSFLFSGNKSQSNSFWALDDISFEVNEGEVLGIIGRNGAGKSTLLKILSRITEPTKGIARIKGRVASLLEVGTGFSGELTGRENIFLNGAILGMKKAEIIKKFDEIVAFAEIEKFIDTPVKRYSSGMYMRLAFAVAAHLKPEILIIDEVLAVGDAQFQKKCIGKMEDVSRKEGRTVLFVSHNMGVIKNLCKRAILLEKGKISSSGDVSKIVEDYEQMSFYLSTKDNLPKGVLFSKQAESTAFDICEVSMTDKDGQFIQKIRTLDSFTFKIKFYSPKIQKNGSVAIFIKNLYGTTILRFATRPDSCLDMDFKEGMNEVICNIFNIPLPAGNYILGVGLAIPMREWLCLENELCHFEIGDKDIHGSGFPPLVQHSAAVTDYNWNIVD